MNGRILLAILAAWGTFLLVVTAWVALQVGQTLGVIQ